MKLLKLLKLIYKMSKEGQIRRGKVYHDTRDREGNYPPSIAGNQYCMADLQVYLDSIKP